MIQSREEIESIDSKPTDTVLYVVHHVSREKKDNRSVPESAESEMMEETERNTVVSMNIKQ